MLNQLISNLKKLNVSLVMTFLLLILPSCANNTSITEEVTSSPNSSSSYQYRLETSNDGSGQSLSDLNLTAGVPVTVYLIQRDSSNRFVANVSGTWTNKNSNGSLTIGSDGKSASYLPSSTGTMELSIAVSGNVVDVTNAITVSVTTPTPTPTPTPTVVKYIYVGNEGSTGVSGFSMNLTTGVPTEVLLSPFLSGTGPGNLVATSNGKYLYSANDMSNDLAPFSISAPTGMLSSLSTNVSTGTFPRIMAINPLNQFLYVVNFTSRTINQLAIGSNGALATIASPIATAANPRGIVVDPAGKFAYVTHRSTNIIYIYSINQTTGELTYQSSVSGIPGGLLVPVSIHPSGDFLYVGDQGNNKIIGYSVDKNSGALTLLPSSPYASGASPTSLTIAPNGLFLYSANWTGNNLYSYSINTTTGALTVVGSPSTVSTCPSSCALDSEGKFLYAVTYCTNLLFTFSVNQGTGELTQVGSGVATGTSPNSVISVTTSF